MGALDNSDFDGITILLEIEDNKYVFIAVYEIFGVRTVDKTLDYISIMGNMMKPYSFAVGEKYTYFISTHYKFIEIDKIEEDTLLNLSSDSFDPFDYHVSKMVRIVSKSY